MQKHIFYLNTTGLLHIKHTYPKVCHAFCACGIQVWDPGKDFGIHQMDPDGIQDPFEVFGISQDPGGVWLGTHVGLGSTYMWGSTQFISHRDTLTNGNFCELTIFY